MNSADAGLASSLQRDRSQPYLASEVSSGYNTWSSPKKIAVCQKTLELKDQKQFKINIWTPEKPRTKDAARKVLLA